MYSSRVTPKAARISASDQCGTRMTSNRPARLSDSPCSTSRGADPNRTTRSPRPARVSSSHRRLTDSDQPAAFWTSSITSTAPAGPVSRRAASHCAAIHSGPRSAGSSALTTRTGTGSPSTAWATSVDLPVCLGPATTWMNRRGSARRRASSAACGRRYGDAGSGLLTMLSSLAQDRVECKTQGTRNSRQWPPSALEDPTTAGGHRVVHPIVASRIADRYRGEAVGAPTPLPARGKPDRRGPASTFHEISSGREG